MTERIEKLAKQAGYKHPDAVGECEDYAYFDHKEFAELIVRECCIALNPMLRDMISRGQGVDMIKLHFGMNPKEITVEMLDRKIAWCERELAKKKSGVEE